VGNALADDFVEEEQSALRVEHLLLGRRDATADGQHRAEEVPRRIGQRRVVGTGNHEGVPIENWTMIKKDHKIRLIQDYVSREGALDDLIKNAPLRGDEITLCLAYERYPSWAGSARNSAARASARSRAGTGGRCSRPRTVGRAGLGGGALAPVPGRVGRALRTK
jgi:hypothetical protein